MNKYDTDYQEALIKEIEALRKENKELKAQIEELRKENKELKAQIEELSRFSEESGK